MLPSQVQLKHYHLTRVEIEPLRVPDSTADALYPDFGDCTFSSKVGINVAQSDPNLFRLSLDLEGAPEDKKHFPYRFLISAEGLFVLANDVAAQHQKDIVLVNGAAILYSALRDILLGITLRMPNGPIMLPTVNFLDLREAPPTDEHNAVSTERQRGIARKRPKRQK